MSSPNKLTLNTNPLQYKRARSKGVNKISKISKVSKIALIKPRTTKNTENMGYSPFKMKGASLYRSPAKDKMSTSMVSEDTAKSHNADYANNPDHLKNMHEEGRSTSIADAESKSKVMGASMTKKDSKK